jgi:glycosyltransferase involved in cell wall biosynthesis
MNILINGNAFAATSFSNVIIHMMYYLRKKGHNVILKNILPLLDTEENLIKRYANHLPNSSKILKGCLYVDHNNFDSAIYMFLHPIEWNIDKKIKIKKHIFYAGWTHANYPLDYAKSLNKYDEVWASSHANAEAIRNTGFCNVPITVVPHGYEKTIFYPKQKNNRIFKIGMCNAISNFKGADVAINAFFRAFDIYDDVELWIQSAVTKDKGEKHGMYYKNLIDIINKYPEKQLKVFYYERNCNLSEMADFYRSCNVILSPHRGDWFGLIPLESLACNVPVIMSEYHGPLDFVTSDYPFWVCGEMTWTNKQSGRHHFPDAGSNLEVYKYFEPNEDHTRDLLIESYKDWMRHSELDCKQYFLGKTWDLVVDMMEGLLNGKNI